MPRYVMLMNWTEQGTARCRDVVARAADIEAVVESLGGRVREHLHTIGEYDIVVVAEFPDDGSEAVAIRRLASIGGVRTTSMRAVTDEETGTHLTGSAKHDRETLTPSRDSDREFGSETAFWPPDA